MRRWSVFGGTFNPGGHFDETLVFFADGTGAIDYFNIDYCGRETFKWELVDEHHLRFDGKINIVRVEIAEFEFGESIDLTDEKSVMLIVYPKGKGERPEKFIKSDNPIESYKIPKEEHLA